MKAERVQVKLNGFLKSDQKEAEKSIASQQPYLEWRWIELRDISVRRMGGTPRKSVAKYWNGDIVWVTAKTITERERYIYDSEIKITKEGLEHSNAKLIPKGSVLLVTTGATAGKVAIAGVDLTTNQQVTAITPKETVDGKFLFYALQFCRDDLLRLGGTTTFKHINQKVLANLKIPLPFKDGKPDIEEQKRVVARIEEITAKIEQAKKIREEALNETEKIMQTALHQIFSKAEEKGWEKKRLESIAFIRKGTINPMDYPDEEFELYSIPAYHTSGEPEIKKGCEIKSSKVLVNPGDCLFGKLNPHVPKIWLVKPYNNRRQIATTEFFPIVPKEKNGNEKWFIPEYIYYVLKSLDFQQRVIHKILGTTASRQRLSPNDILEEEIPLPPVEEQKQVIEHLNRLDEKVRMLKRNQQEISQKIDKMTKAVLEKAFSGRL
jgi:type I restriction enzyme S subunit